MFVGVPVLMVALLLVLIVLRSPILVRVPDLDSTRGYPLLVIYNPFRDKAPEIAAQHFLESLRDGRCADSVSSFNRERSIDICAKQSQYPLLDWKLIDLTEEGGSYQLTYKHQSRNAVGDEDMRVWVKRVEQDWKVDSFTIVY